MREPNSEERPQPEEGLEQTLGQDERILVVDDEDTIRTVISELLREEGHEVVDVPSGEVALEAFREKPFPLVITDIVMGKMTGIELMVELKKIDPETQVIVMTSHASMDTSIKALKMGAYDYLIKPFDDLDQVVNIVTRAIEKINLTRRNQNLVEILQSHTVEMETASWELKDMAIRDGLTGLFNHRHFMETLEIELARAKRGERSLSIIMIDVDHFKCFNDTHGHPAGDRLLKKLAGILTEAVRISDVVARYGGEEFIFLLPETGKGGAIFAERIRQRVEDHPFEGGQTQPAGRVTVSVGVAVYPDDGEEEGSVLIEKADQALYKAKEGGRNAVVLA